MSFLDRVRGRAPAKAVYGGAAAIGWSNDIPLSVRGQDWQGRARSYLDAYKVGWFYKAGSRISRDTANLAWTLSYEDTEGDNAEQIVAGPTGIEFDVLDPLEQFLRLSEYPNPFQTGRSFKQQQQIRLDFTGRALIYLENGDGGGLPTAFFGISPHRMWPSYDKNGHLVGWVLDKDRNGGGQPFTAEEILVIEYPGVTAYDGSHPDPVGVVESVYAHVPLSAQIPRHVSDVLATGGRLAGMAWPKNRALDEGEFQEAQRAWRNVTSDPNAARRLLLFPEPMEYSTGAATPSEIGIPELALLNRDEILPAFPISPYILGVPMPGGLNSAETRKEDRHDYWEGTIHPRTEVWEDAFQQQLIPRYEAAVGRPLDFDIEEPNLDNAPTLIEKVGALRGLWEAGFDPKDAVAAVELDHIKWNGLPDLLNPAKQAEMAAAAAAAPTVDPTAGMTAIAGDSTRTDRAVTTQTVVGKAITRTEVLGREFPGLQAALNAFLAEQRDRVIADIEATYPATKAERMKANDDWWDAEQEDRLLRERLRTVYLSVGRDALSVVAENTGRVITRHMIDSVLEKLLAKSGVRITDINETTRKTIADTLAEGTRRGYSIQQLTRGVAAEGYGGVQGALMANGVNVWDDLRAETIARTETMNAYNTAALTGYGDLGVREVQAIDGDKDEECASRDGRTYSLDDAESVTDHPNGTLDWVPISKAYDSDGLRDLATKALDIAAAAAAVVPVVNVPPPEPVTVNVAPARGKMKFLIVRDDTGRVAGITEEPA